MTPARGQSVRTIISSTMFYRRTHRLCRQHFNGQAKGFFPGDGKMEKFRLAAVGASQSVVDHFTVDRVCKSDSSTVPFPFHHSHHRSLVKMDPNLPRKAYTRWLISNLTPTGMLRITISNFCSVTPAHATNSERMECILSIALRRSVESFRLLPEYWW
ncbi:bifunctional 5,10-methylene-tetrahydrofolate dehydrogenase [Anopheles sinensis]|uniref:Bifunctional 5,10-methylene-tetrahydrofolate dehydrogenase n=1 Tax=Anopheles sinensis TaxID=74873 RepID=A0A084WMA1_ANOSI|nr:bifunctional 5,10-methylene-tetrahydrofolate dehydrogenase [Anopheles sinensis]